MKKSIHDEIAEVAYDLYAKVGSVHGNDLKDWFEAEDIVIEKHERHTIEMEKKVVNINKPPVGHRRTAKKEGFHNKI